MKRVRTKIIPSVQLWHWTELCQQNNLIWVTTYQSADCLQYKKQIADILTERSCKEWKPSLDVTEGCDYWLAMINVETFTFEFHWPTSSQLFVYITRNKQLTFQPNHIYCAATYIEIGLIFLSNEEGQSYSNPFQLVDFFTRHF